MFNNYRQEWFGNIRGDILSALVVGLALVPEAIAFSIIAGVDPQVGLYASFSMAVIIAFVGGRPAMISAATGAMALLMVTLVKEHGLQYLFAATVLTGIFQIIIGKIKLAKLMRFVSKSVVTGFLNALAILIFIAQLPELTHVSPMVYVFVALGLAIIYLFPYIPKLGQVIPSPLVCIVTLSILAVVFHVDIRTVGDMGTLPNTLPVFLIPNIPFNFETLSIIAPYSTAMAFVGLLESMMTATILDDMTETSSDKHQECVGQGVANIATGFLGGMAGCAMIGQSMINVKSGGRGRLSTFLAGIFLLILVVFISKWLQVIPMAALVAVMIMVCIGTFDWKSLNFKKNPKNGNIIMVATVVVVVATHNLALGVLTGVVLSALFLVNKLEKDLEVDSFEDGTTRYFLVKGQIFFSSAEQLSSKFNVSSETTHVVVDLSQAQIWDITSVSTLEIIAQKFDTFGVTYEFLGLTQRSKFLFAKYALNKNLNIT